MYNYPINFDRRIRTIHTADILSTYFSVYKDKEFITSKDASAIYEFIKNYLNNISRSHRGIEYILPDFNMFNTNKEYAAHRDSKFLNSKYIEIYNYELIEIIIIVISKKDL